MDIMVKSSHEGSWVGELMRGVGIFVPFSLEAVQAIKEFDVVHVDFVRTDANDGTWVSTVSGVSSRCHKQWKLTIFLVHLFDFPDVFIILDRFIVRLIFASQSGKLRTRKFGQRA